MDAGLLAKLFGKSQEWQGPCVVVLDADASVQTVGTDSVAGGGTKLYAPRAVSGRIAADSALLLADGTAMMLIQQVRVRQATGEEVVKQTLTIADPRHIVAIEYAETAGYALQAMGLTAPPVRGSGSHSGILTRPRPVVS